MRHPFMKYIREHLVLILFVTLSSIIAAIIYELNSGGKPRAYVYNNPQLNAIDLRGVRPPSLWRNGEFECLGWKATHDCNPYGRRDYTKDRGCNEELTRVSGYCEVRNKTSGDIYHVMIATCNSWQWYLIKGKVTCNQARLFTDYSYLSAQSSKNMPLAVMEPGIQEKVKENERGIVMIGYPRVIAATYAIVKILRQHGCTLPVEIWIREEEMKISHSVLVKLVSSYNVVIRRIQDTSMTEFYTKLYAIYHSQFQELLFLDSDNIPLRDPTYLFNSSTFKKFGAMFWPDYWRPTAGTPFNVHEQSALWQLLDMPFTDMFEFESGQMVIDKRRSQDALSKAMFFATPPRLLNDWHLVYGDKDIFRLAWLNTSTPFYMSPHIVMTGGLFDPENRLFCGVAMVQRDPDGEILFIHRNQNKITGREGQTALVTHTQTFTPGDAFSLKSILDTYWVRCKMRILGQYTCFYINPMDGPGPWKINDIRKTTYHSIEAEVIKFAREGRLLMTAKEIAPIQIFEDTKLSREFVEPYIPGQIIVPKSSNIVKWSIGIIFSLTGAIIILYLRNKKVNTVKIPSWRRKSWEVNIRDSQQFLKQAAESMEKSRKRRGD